MSKKIRYYNPQKNIPPSMVFVAHCMAFNIHHQWLVKHIKIGTILKAIGTLTKSRSSEEVHPVTILPRRLKK